MATSRKTQSALRAALKNEDAALAERLPDAGKPSKPTAAKPAAAPALDAPSANDKAATARRPSQSKPAARRAPMDAQTKAVKSAPATADVATTPPAASVAGVSPQMRPVSPIKSERRVRETFSLGRSDIERLAALKARGKKNGSKYGRSEILRAGLVLLEAQDATTVSALIEQLPAFKKDKRKKK